MSRPCHEPNLSTVLMIERAIKNANDYPTKAKLWKSLPKKTEYPTFKRALDYLEASNKIVFNGKTIIWTAADNPKLKRFLETAVEIKD